MPESNNIKALLENSRMVPMIILLVNIIHYQCEDSSRDQVLLLSTSIGLDHSARKSRTHVRYASKLPSFETCI